MKTLHVQTASSSYPVFIGQGIRKKACELLTSLNRPLTRIMLVTDEEVTACMVMKCSICCKINGL